jgi:hypothetical protein
MKRKLLLTSKVRNRLGKGKETKMFNDRDAEYYPLYANPDEDETEEVEGDDDTEDDDEFDDDDDVEDEDEPETK